MISREQQTALTAGAKAFLRLNEVEQREKHISELAREVVREDLTLSFGQLDSIDLEEAVAKAIQMSGEGKIDFFAENLANFHRADRIKDLHKLTPEEASFKIEEMKTPHWGDLEIAAEVLITANYSAIIQTIEATADHMDYSDNAA